MVYKRETYRKGHLTVQPQISAELIVPFRGEKPLDLGNKKKHLIYVPQGYEPAQPAGLAVMLHGAGGDAAHGMSLIRSFADEHNIILIAPASEAYSWDIIADHAFGNDVLLIDQALDFAFRHFSIDPSRVAIGGFSDGASYALCIGLGNGHLFSHILAFSPGFAYWVERRGKPNVFISHGTRDAVLPIDPCSRRIVPRLQQHHISVQYHEFDGEHTIPTHIAQAAMHWFQKG